jgi:protein-disulfide isomerase
MIGRTPAGPRDITGPGVGLDGRVLVLDRPIGDGDHGRGPIKAPVQVVEYGDYQCPYCAAAASGVKEVLSAYADQVVFAFRHFPLVSQHPNAWAAALAAEAAGRQGRFWEMHDHLLSHQHSLEAHELRGHAKALGLDMGRFEEDLRDPRLADHVRADAMSALRSGVAGTPTFFVSGRRLEGGYGPVELRTAIDGALPAAAG